MAKRPFRAAFRTENPINMRSESRAKTDFSCDGDFVSRGIRHDGCTTPRNDVPMERSGRETRRTYANFPQRPAKSPKAVQVPILQQFEKNGVTMRFPAARRKSLLSSKFQRT